MADPTEKYYHYVNLAPGWKYVGFMALNGTQLYIITLTSPDCTTGYNTNQVLTMPPDDGLIVGQ